MRRALASGWHTFVQVGLALAQVRDQELSWLRAAAVGDAGDTDGGLVFQAGLKLK